MIILNGTSAELFPELNREKELRAALTKAYRLLARRSRTRHELREKLAAKGFDSEIVDQVIRLCEEQKYLNDREYAKQFIQHRLQDRPAGRSILERELHKRGVDEETRSQILDEIFEGRDEAALANEAAEKQRKRYVNLPSRKAQQRLAGFLLRRGFDWETIRKVDLWNEILTRNEEDG